MKVSPLYPRHLIVCITIFAFSLNGLVLAPVAFADPPAAKQGRTGNICDDISAEEQKLIASGSKDPRTEAEDKVFNGMKLKVRSTYAPVHHTPPLGVGPAANTQLTFLNEYRFHVGELCRQKSAIVAKVEALSAGLQTEEGADMCGRFKQSSDLATTTGSDVQAYVNQVKEKKTTLKNIYVQDAKANMAGISQLAIKSAADDPKIIHLQAEFKLIWGSNITEKDFNSSSFDVNKFQPDASSYFGSLYGQLDQIQKANEAILHKLAMHRTNVQMNLQKCGQTDPNAAPPAVDPNAPDPTLRGDLTKNGSTPNSTISGNETPPAATTPTSGTAEKPPLESWGDTNTNTTTNTNTNTYTSSDTNTYGGGHSYTATETDTNTDTHADTLIGPVESKEGWISRNKETLLLASAGTAAVVGGVIYYKRDQDKKKARQASLEDALNASASSSSSNSQTTVTSTTTSTDSTAGGTPASTSTPQGSSFVISGIPSGASVTKSVTPITVAIVDPQRILTQDNNTDITVSCSSPIPCSLTGILTVKTANGKAVFNDLHFTETQAAVRLQFSAPGFTTVVSSSSFDVTSQ